MARTTVTIDDGLLDEAKRRAAERGTTLSCVIAEGLRAVLAEDGAVEGGAEPFRIRVFEGGRFLLGPELPPASEMLGMLDELEWRETLTLGERGWRSSSVGGF